MATNGFALPHGLTGEIIRLAGGNPFFIEEVVKSLFDQGVIVRRERGIKVTEKASAITIPATITDVLMARIDRLEEPTKQLVKVAAVIGHSFSFRILSDVASEVEDIPGRLSFLSEMQILQPQERMGEANNYTFKHALAQEAAYESILPSRRRELHLKVALSIERNFSTRLPEFYGMLAYHYGRAEDLEKTEEYLIKAGEEALRSAASDEALHHYEEALQLYLKESGPDADPEKVAMLEKNISLALYNRGQHQEAIKHFEKALDHYWGKLPKGAIFVAVKLVPAFAHFLTALYFPSLKFRKTPTERDTEIIDLFSKKINSLSLIDAKRSFIEYFYLFRFISSFDLKAIKQGYAIFLTSSPLFTFSGISFGLSRKALASVRESVGDDITNYTMYELCEAVHNFLGGDWNALKDCDDDLVDKNCRIGEIWMVSQYLYWHALGNICRGSFDKAREIVDRLDALFEVYGNDLSKTVKYEVNTVLLIESGRLDDAMIESEKGLDFEEKARSGWWFLHVYRAWISIMMGAPQKAEECLQRADSIRLQAERAPFQLSPHFKTQLDFHLYRLKEATKSGNRAEMDESRRKAIKSMKSLEKVARKVAYHRTDYHRLAGAYYWTIEKQKNALRQWHRAVEEGERMGAKPQLARLYFEVGRCLLAEKGKRMKLDGFDGEACIERARGLFEEMKVESSLDEIDRVLGAGKHDGR